MRPNRTYLSRVALRVLVLLASSPILMIRVSPSHTLRRLAPTLCYVKAFLRSTRSAAQRPLGLSWRLASSHPAAVGALWNQPRRHGSNPDTWAAESDIP